MSPRPALGTRSTVVVFGRFSASRTGMNCPLRESRPISIVFRVAMYNSFHVHKSQRPTSTGAPESSYKDLARSQVGSVSLAMRMPHKCSQFSVTETSISVTDLYPPNTLKLRVARRISASNIVGLAACRKHFIQSYQQIVLIFLQVNSGVSARIHSALVWQCRKILRPPSAFSTACASGICLHWKMPGILNKRSRTSVDARLVRIQCSVLELNVSCSG